MRFSCRTLVFFSGVSCLQFPNFFVVVCKQAESMKHEAGGVLGEVKQKQTEATKAVDLLRALRKLREARKQEAEVKGTQA